jgi:hypothetical protein
MLSHIRTLGMAMKMVYKTLVTSTLLTETLIKIFNQPQLRFELLYFVKYTLYLLSVKGLEANAVIVAACSIINVAYLTQLSLLNCR